MLCFFFFKQKTAYEMRISDWSSDVCSSDLRASMGSVIVAPMPTAAPLIAPITGFFASKMRIDTRPPESRISGRSEERRVGKSVSVRVDLGGRRLIKKKKTNYDNL